MSKIIIIGGIESTYKNAQILHEIGEEICMFYTRGEKSPGWEGVDLIDESKFPFASQVPKTVVQGNINEHTEEMEKIRPDYIWSLGWQQMYRAELLNICPFIGIHESLLPDGAGCVPLAHAICRGFRETGITLFYLDNGVDTGNIIAQLRCTKSPQMFNATEIYQEMMELEEEIIRMYAPLLQRGVAPSIPQDMTKRRCFGKINWDDFPPEVVARARVYPYA